MSGEFSVNLDHLDYIVTQLEGLASNLTTHLTDLDKQVATLHSGSWESEAADAHQTAHNKWAVAAKEFADGVKDMSVAARKAHQEYTDAGTANVKMVKA
ncbi:WXG100 family type VII secretion target [Nocardia sp. ET3-3]|uniref:WXG100 family type VII secretion target n=1 Tax=Nocardia terrae TaxID=2675851 RepID=A0A7K1UX48_9NOCA|nr:WXG100 family type VII secretion target [Nocardia terrae]MVU78960.1 WXG100 family type VII secretion target [Nocardia terrae]